MAVNLQKTLGFSLGNLVQSRLLAFQKSRAEAQVKEELSFYKQTSQGMSYEDQLAFRNSQMEKEKGRNVPDQDYIVSIKKEIASLKKLVANETFTNAYRKSFTNLTTGMETFQEHIDFLNTELKKTSDPEQKKTVSDYLSEARQSQYVYEQKVLDNYYQYATNDSTESVLNKAILDIKTEKAKALGGGDTLRASALDLKSQALNQKLSEAKIDKSINEFNLNKLKTYNPADYIDSLNGKISTADTQSPITYNGVSYANEKEFWLAQRQNYFESGNFDKANQKYWSDVSQINFNQSQTLYSNKAGLMAQEINRLMTKPELEDFKSIIAGSNASILSGIADTAAKTILDRASINYDFQTATNKLSQLATDTGIDQVGNYNLLISNIAKIKDQDVNAILEAKAQFLEQGMSEQEASKQAIVAYNSGKLGVNVSPETIAGKSPTDTAKEAEGQGTTKPFGSLSTPGNLGAYNEGDLLKLGSNPTVYQYSNGQIRAIGSSKGTVSDTMLREATGKSFADVKTISEVSSLKKGADIILKPTPAVYKAKLGQKYRNYAPETEFLMEGTNLRPISSMQAKEQSAPGIKAQEVDVSFFNDKKIGEIL